MEKINRGSIGAESVLFAHNGYNGSKEVLIVKRRNVLLPEERENAASDDMIYEGAPVYYPDPDEETEDAREPLH
ncbi:hypothetical protein ALCH109712_15595 [Alkalicoccus chagannorensis]